MTPVKENIKVTHSINQRTINEEEDDLVTKLLRPYSKFLVHYPWIPLCILFVIVVLSAVLGVIGSTGAPPLPEFSDPTKGFEPRGTTIASRAKSLTNLEKSSNSSGLLKKACALNDVLGLSSSTVTDLRSFATDCLFVYGHKDANVNLFDYMSTICNLHKSLLVDYPGYNNYFIDSHHLPSYIALVNNKTDCQNINKNDTKYFIYLLQLCVKFYTNGALKSCTSGECKEITSDRCKTHAYIFYNTFQYLTPSGFVQDVTQLKLTNSIDRLWEYNTVQANFFKPLYDDKLKNLDNAELNGVEVKGFDFYNFKLHLFQTEIILQSLFIITAIVLVILFIWFYSGSLFIGLTTFFCILVTLIISYFVYSRIFQMEFFPFLNMVTLIFIVGIGADDAFVYMGMWEEAKRMHVIKNSQHHKAYLVRWTTSTLRHASLAMLVTSLTTASAFYANISSPVTSVKCFGLYAGTSIIVNYLLMLTLFPACVIIHDLYLSQCMHSCCPNLCKAQPAVADDGKAALEITSSNGSDLNANNVESNKITRMQKCESVFNFASDKVFHEYLPLVVLKFKYIWIGVLLTLGVGGAVVTFGKPGLKRPSTSDFQMFTDSSSLEQYSLNYKSMFAFGRSGSGFYQFSNISFGVKAVDNGNKFNPDDHGTLELNTGTLDVASVQVWLYNFCVNLKNADFYRSSSTCGSIEKLFLMLEQNCPAGHSKCCNKTLPLPRSEFLDCFHQSVSFFSCYSFYGLMFDESNNLKTLVIDLSTNKPYSDEFQYNEDLFKAFDSWFSTQFSNVTSTTFNGWWNLDQTFYDLQKSLFEGTKMSLVIAIAVSFVIILLTTWNLLLSIYSILTISFIISVTVGILVLSGWELNIMESVVFSVAAGLSADFTLHYSVAYKTSIIQDKRVERVKSAISNIGPAIAMGAFTTFIAGLVMLPSTILSYIQMAQFLMLVMFVSWVYSTFFFLPLCAVIGPVGTTCQLTFNKMKSARASFRSNSRDRIEMEPVPTNHTAGGVYYGPTE
ncbi:protein dispatched homolog 1-like isoform X2 [Hydractinia symbiolongicarpus]|nr:protein dispatched homolog 1-like isoform X2 [Hydractinia symbiolongicarpus]XP_057308076.1 protein dispatched homolog 1-like isoform X2 [Hydractinia symbiolongicarpus]XP_057308083.1 protein dispatched homolog 1-like isoform X2 [Hydractinia symbiolongicarpus]XP_057308089.1 protein dispatched homolog 1-like isoform X2 [Hydractinia symbiolongicarpus]